MLSNGSWLEFKKDTYYENIYYLSIYLLFY